MRKLAWHITIGIIVILILFNPSINDFRTYLRLAPEDQRYGAGREANYIVCSLYDGLSDEKYIGILGNFWLIKDSPPVIESKPSPDTDTSQMRKDTTIN